MQVLVIGSGGREHALAWRLARDDAVKQVFVAPGNAGTESLKVKNVDARSVGQWLAIAEDCEIDLTVVGPEQPLADGVVDAFARQGHAILGPTAAAAKIEGSKSYAKELMQRRNIPTANHVCVESIDQAKLFLQDHEPPYVIKADGLARGKATDFADNIGQALAMAEEYLAGKYGAASKKIVLEQRLAGEELSLTALCDGKNHVLLPGCTDYKRLLDGDKGPNTGGMGAVSPSLAEARHAIDLDEAAQIVVVPVLEELSERGSPFRGFLYVGLMVTESGGLVVLEYNCRLGDPEAQVILPRVNGELVAVLAAAAKGHLADGDNLSVSPEHCVGVVLASEGYPEEHGRGQEISFPAACGKDMVFHAGTALGPQGATMVDGGRVASAVSMRPTLADAREAAYGLADQVCFANRHLRKDIAKAS